LRQSLAVAGVLWVTLGGAARGYPIAEERKLGERFSIEAASELPVIREPAVVDYVNRLGRRIVSHLDAPQPFDYRFQVVRDAHLNAFAVPGGFVYANSGLLLRVGNEAELAGVLAHEIGHTHAHHIVRQQEQTRLLNYAALAGVLLSVVHPAIAAAAIGANTTMQLKYQREFEEEADYLGIRYMGEAGFDPHGMTAFMKRMWDEQRMMPLDQIPPYMLSHPMTEERINHLEAATKDTPEQVGWKTPTFALERVQAILRAITGAPSTSITAQRAPGDRALALSGLTRLYRGDAQGALAELEAARREGVSGLETDIGLARLRLGDVDGAIRILKEAIEAEPESGVARATLGRALLTKNDYALAVRELERARALAPEVDEIEYDLGQAYGRGGERGKGFYHLGRALEMRGQVEKALIQYDKASRLLEPESDEAIFARERAVTLGEISRGRVIGR
jgi:predicted Zn-dependent protease